MATTSHLTITLVEQSQAQKEVTVNQALTRIDAVLNSGAKSRTVSTPPGSPLSGDAYIVGSSPTGAWSGQADKIAYYDQLWRFITPNQGALLYVNDEARAYVYSGSAWLAYGQHSHSAALTAGTTVSWDLALAPNASLIPAQNFTLSNPSNMRAGTYYTLLIKQDATGSRIITWGSAYKFPGGSAFVLSTAANKTDIVRFYCDGAALYGVGNAGFA